MLLSYNKRQVPDCLQTHYSLWKHTLELLAEENEGLCLNTCCLDPRETLSLR
jgi:hypothetical protein